MQEHNPWCPTDHFLFDQSNLEYAAILVIVPETVCTGVFKALEQKNQLQSSCMYPCPAAIMVTVRNTRSTKTYLEQPRLVTCISRRWQKTLIPRFTSENHIDCFLNLSIKMSRDQRATWVVPQLTDKMKNSLKDRIVRKDIWVVGGTVFLVLLLLFQRYWDCL